LDASVIIEWHDLVMGSFVSKVNRFAAHVEVSGTVCYTHVPNPTLATELLKPGAEVLLARLSPGHKTEFRLLAAKSGSLWATIDTSVPNVVFREGIRRSLFAEFAGAVVKKEGVRLGRSLIDFLLSDGKPIYVEVKSCTLVRDGTALFPDAVTERGFRHLRELEGVVASGGTAYLVWIVQRPDAERLMPYREKDPMFAAEVVRAQDIGVSFLAYSCSFDASCLRLIGRLPVVIE
jgi:sugar fermentation stimulation protein A